MHIYLFTCQRPGVVRGMSVSLPCLHSRKALFLQVWARPSVRHCVHSALSVLTLWSHLYLNVLFFARVFTK